MGVSLHFADICHLPTICVPHGTMHIYDIPRSRIVGVQRPNDYTMYGSKQTIHYLIWYNHKATVCRVFASSVYPIMAIPIFHNHDTRYL